MQIIPDPSIRRYTCRINSFQKYEKVYTTDDNGVINAGGTFLKENNPSCIIDDNTEIKTVNLSKNSMVNIISMMQRQIEKIIRKIVKTIVVNNNSIKYKYCKYILFIFHKHASIPSILYQFLSIKSSEYRKNLLGGAD